VKNTNVREAVQKISKKAATAGFEILTLVVTALGVYSTTL
jgi:hypothetical protein